MIFFETSTSVFELLWDIALALFILRISLTYFLLTFLSSLFLAYLHFSTTQPLNSLTYPLPTPLFLTFYVLLITLWARWTVVVYEVPRVRGFRIAIGAMACVYLVLAEFVCAGVLYEWGGMGWVWERNRWEALEGFGVLAVVVVMPALLMLLERETDEMGEVRSKHGHEGKSIVDAVPTVAMSGKKID